MAEFENTYNAVAEALAAIKEAYTGKLTNNDVSTMNADLANSVADEVEFDNGVFRGVFRLNDYWKYVEYGRKKGKFPPVDAIKQWIITKPIMPRPINGITPTNDQLAFLIGRKIRDEGIPARPYLQESADEVLKEWLPKIQQALEADIGKSIALEYADSLQGLKNIKVVRK